MISARWADYDAPVAGPRTKLFKACNGALRFDIQLALFLLPYLVQNVVAHGSDEARSDVQSEVCFIGSYVPGFLHFPL